MNDAPRLKALSETMVVPSIVAEVVKTFGIHNAGRYA